MGHKGHYGEYSGNAKHSKHHMVNSWEEEDVKRGKKQMAEGHTGHAEALFDDAHGSYNYDGHNSTGAEHNGMSRKENMQEEHLRKQVENYPKPMPAEAPKRFLQTAPKRLFQSYKEEGNTGFPTQEYLQGKYEDYMDYGSENPNAPGFGPSRNSGSPMFRHTRPHKLRQKAIKISEESGAERGDSYDYENPQVVALLEKANKLDKRTGKKSKKTS